MSLEKDILKVLAYFDIFRHPVSSKEIRSFLACNPGEREFEETLHQLCIDEHIYHRDGFYFLHNDHSLVFHRRENNKRAEGLLKTAYKISSFLFQFPFVRGIGISGSLSKNVADKDADIDFFVITTSNRLWIARTFMHLFKKLTFLVGKQHWFCMNYYVDEEALQINEKNIYTAIEVITLLPVCGNGILEQFFDANSWTTAFFPNYYFSTQSKMKSKSSVLKKSVEWLFEGPLGERLDNYLMRVTSKRWLKKERSGRVNIKGGRMGLRVSKHYSKPNPAFFQEKVLLLYEDKLKEVDRKLHTCIVN